MAPNPDYNNLAAFHAKLARSRRILAVCGAGLSASSGLATFRGAGGLWRNYKATALGSPEAFEKDSGLVWMFYAYVRRSQSMRAR
jgi:NAD-dependent SIR2 family protein deacetylase